MVAAGTGRSPRPRGPAVSLCSSCYNRSELRPRRLCGRCGRVAPICVRANGTSGDICVDCYQLPVARLRGVRPDPALRVGRCRDPDLCPLCPRATAPAAHCGAERPPAARWAEGPVCDTCYTTALRRRGTCAGCGAERRLVSPPGPGATAAVTAPDSPPCTPARCAAAKTSSTSVAAAIDARSPGAPPSC